MRKGGNRDAARTLTIDEELRLLDWTYRNRSFRDYLVILTILRTGLRTNELREVLVSDICADGEILPHLEVRAEVQQFLRWKENRGESITPTSFFVRQRPISTDHRPTPPANRPGIDPRRVR